MLATSQVANNLSYLILLVTSMVVSYKHFQNFSAYRLISLMIIYVIVAAYLTLIGFGVNSIEVFTGISAGEITIMQYFVGISVCVISASLYLLVLSIIEAVKGERVYAQSKSRS